MTEQMPKKVSVLKTMKIFSNAEILIFLIEAEDLKPSNRGEVITNFKSI